jgi:branched-subunit amino acid ABC-type transport system permease component
VLTTSHITGLISFTVIILILIFRPQGISGHE